MQSRALVGLADHSGVEGALQIGQTVVARVLRVDLVKERFSVTLLVPLIVPYC